MTRKFNSTQSINIYNRLGLEVSNLNEFRVDILGEIIEKNWCSSFEHLLKSASDHDTREKILISMSSLLDNCRQAFTTSSSLRETLMSLQSEYDSTGNDDDLYFAQIKHRVDDILKLVDSNKERVDL